jgi:hypothetical protein
VLRRSRGEPEAVIGARHKKFCGIQATFSVFIQSRDYGKRLDRRSMATNFPDAADGIE